MLGIAEVPEQFKVDACICDRKKSWQKVFNLELEKRLNGCQSDRQALLQKLGYRRDFEHELSFVFKCGIFRVVLDRAFEQREPLFFTFVIVKPLWIPRMNILARAEKATNKLMISYSFKCTCYGSSQQLQTAILILGRLWTLQAWCRSSGARFHRYTRLP